MKLPASLNVGFSEAVGNYYTWTSDDNMYKSNAIETMVNYLDKNIKTCQKNGLISEAESNKIAKWALIKLYLIRSNSTLINAVKTYNELSQ